MIQSIEDGRKEDGNRSISDKIIKRLHDLDKTVENNQGRWAWELLQNAKDSIAEDSNRRVSIQIKLEKDSIEFRHDGTYFTEQDVRGLINQISSKEIDEGQETNKTGRFGTGFLTTHLLSRAIKIKGVLNALDKNTYEFEFLLDRRGKTIKQMIPQIEKSWSDFNTSIKKINSNSTDAHLTTSFCYQLETEEQVRIAKVGIEEFSRLIPLALVFSPKISRVEIINNTTGITTTFENNNELIDGLITPISRTENGDKTEILILHLSDKEVTIAAEIEKLESGYSVRDINNIPKLFCDFPLVGTENFYFPVIINSFFFNPQTERDGIWLKGNDDPEVDENQEILESAVELYRKLLSIIIEKDFFDLYNIAETRMPGVDKKYFDEKWYGVFIQNPIREILLNSEIIELEDKTAKKRAIKDLIFPSIDFKEEIRNKIWQFTFDLAPNLVCKKIHLNSWCLLHWDTWRQISYKSLICSVSQRGNIHELSHDLAKSEHDTFNWLNTLGNFIIEDESNLLLLDRHKIIPNRNGIFREKKDLYIDEIKDDDLINILELLGEDWKEILLHSSVAFGDYNNKDKKDIATRVTRKLQCPDNSDAVAKAINLLSEWFENNPQLGETLFTELYSRRAELFMNTIEDKESLYKVMRTCTDLSTLAEVAKSIEHNPKISGIIQEIEELTELLREFSADNISDLKKIIASSKSIPIDNPKVQITEEILLSLGVTSIEELKEALTDSNIADKFTHVSTPTKQMFLSVKKLIKRAKSNILKYLNTLADYDCSESEELATTVIGGIKRNGLPVYIVTRPSDNKEVILYYSSEKDTLDNHNSELWIDNGIDKPRCLTLGKILKITGINRIPV